MYNVVGSVMIIIMILGNLENFTVIYTYVTNRKIRTVDNVFIVGIAVSDMGQAILGVPLVVASSFSKHWIFGYRSCQYYAFITTFLGISQVALLTSLAVDRILLLIGAFILSWLPYSVVSMWSALGIYKSIPAWSQ
ncbi:melanopsin-like, partial [Ruditapes philippinarum]|uniref:melanopsin-like n=1 Tax=Ruditapes philippinarum TaxID=129788 RepID=UPI00295BBAD0